MYGSIKTVTKAKERGQKRSTTAVTPLLNYRSGKGGKMGERIFASRTVRKLDRLFDAP